MSDARWMDRALAQADRALGNTAPNPSVGAVVVRDGAVIGEGFTQRVGGPHAERRALEDCRERGHDPAGATMYVTLEPCRHHGRTPPCTEVILESGLARVVVGVLDPFPAMRGQSVAYLREQGVEVTLGVREEACARRVLGFARVLSAGLPEVTCKAGISADGRIATEAGESRWITSPEARQDGHRLRASHDAVLVGIGTALADDPQLTVRLPTTDPFGAVDRKPVVPVVLDTDLRLPPDARLLTGGRAIVICANDVPDRALAARIVRVPRLATGGLDLEAALRALAAHDLHRILVEGGGLVHRGLLDVGLVDNVALYVAGKLIPGGRPWIGGAPLGALGNAVQMELSGVCRVGPDVRLSYRLEHALAPDPLGPLRSPAESPTR